MWTSDLLEEDSCCVSLLPPLLASPCFILNTFWEVVIPLCCSAAADDICA